MTGFDSATVPADVLFVEADDCLLIFASIADAESSLTKADVDDGTCREAYGRNGEPLEIRTEAGTVRIRHGGAVNRPDELKELLLRYFEDCADPADDTESLDAMVARAWAIEHEHWERCGEGRGSTGIPLWACAVLIPLAIAGVYFLIR